VSDEKKNGRISLASVAMVVGIVGGPLAVYSEAQVDRGRSAERLQHIEKRQEEDRKDTRQAISEVREHVKIIDQNTQVILQSIKVMEAEQRAERRARQK